MREGQFIKQHKERWDEYQQNPSDDPDELAKRFSYLVDDLAFAKTFYAGSNTTRYINGLAAKIYLDIYKNKKEQSNRFFSFWKTELPLIAFKYRRILLFSFLLFSAFYLLGAIASAIDPDFVKMILGADYVEMTEENIAKGDPFGVYKSQDSFSMFLFIAWNNIRVSLMMFGSGIFAGLGTLYLLFRNGIMVGAFDYMFYQHHLGGKFILVVFIHGTLELSAIVVAACSGFMLASAMLFPETYTRLQSLQIAAKDAIKMIIGLAPIIITAAFFESYITRHTEMPVFLSVTILASSLAFVLFYYVFYPTYLFKKFKAKYSGQAF